MKLERLSRFINALNTPAQTTQLNSTAAQSAAIQNEEAVKVSSGLTSNETTQSERQKKIDSLKEQVATGAYKPDSMDVARAIANDLFA